MKKSNLITGIICVLIGIASLLIAFLSETKLESTLASFAGWGLVYGVLTIRKYLYWNSPENKERGQEILENEKIDMQDELKVKVRDKAGRYSYLFGIYIICFSIFIFGILDKLELIENARMMILYLGGYLIVQLIAGKFIFDHIIKKYYDSPDNKV